MKHLRIALFYLTCLAVIVGCNRSTHEHHDHAASEAVTNDENVALYDEVMEIHDEGMNRTGEIHRVKKTLKEKLNDSEGKRKVAIEAAITRLDSAYDGMMKWMREFNPEDATDSEAYREYLEVELEKIRKVRQDIVEALETAEEEIKR